MHINYIKLYLTLTLSGISLILIFHLLEINKPYFESKLSYNVVKNSSINLRSVSSPSSDSGNSNKINSDVCNFWRAEYHMNPNTHSKAFMYATCEIAEGSHQSSDELETLAAQLQNKLDFLGKQKPSPENKRMIKFELCKYWKRNHEETKSDYSKMIMNSTC